MYDLAETLDQIPTNTLYVLENRFVVAKSGLVRCCMDRLIPLGTSDGKWPKFSCDRLIEKLHKYRTVYFTKTVCSQTRYELNCNNITIILFLLGEEGYEYSFRRNMGQRHREKAESFGTNLYQMDKSK